MYPPFAPARSLQSITAVVPVVLHVTPKFEGHASAEYTLTLKVVAAPQEPVQFLAWTQISYE